MNAVVLMSTYNGQKFIAEQLDSILNQEWTGKIEIFIRDDGSADDTVDIIKGYQAGFSNIFLIEGENIGPCASFFKLISQCKKRNKANIYLLSDQDDYWLPNKIQLGIDVVNNNPSPTLYASNLQVTDEHLQKIGLFNHRKKVKIFDPIYINSVTGCSAAWNYEFLNVIRVPKSTENVLMHDWWLYLTATYLGEFFYDENPPILYRQHGGNVVGYKSFFDRLKGLITGSIGSNSRIKQFSEFLTIYHSKLQSEECFSPFYKIMNKKNNRYQYLKMSVLTLKKLSFRAILSSLTLR
jgi:rhamnosyltransferase